jgi:hypothetical protein
MIIELSDIEKQAIDHVIAYVGNTTTDWFTIKLQLVKSFPPSMRSGFSPRHAGSMKFFVNAYEQTIMTYWKEKTGNTLCIDESRLHPKDWHNKPRGWALIKLNNERRKAKTTT